MLCIGPEFGVGYGGSAVIFVGTRAHFITPGSTGTEQSCSVYKLTVNCDCTLRLLQNFAKMSVDGPVLATISVDRMSSKLGMCRDAAEAVRFAVDRILASSLS